MFNGNGVFLQNGKNVIPSGIIAERLMAGDFGPHPNQSAPPGFRIPEIVQALQNPTTTQEDPQTGGLGGWQDALNRFNLNKQMGFTGTAGYFGDSYTAAPNTLAGQDLALIQQQNPQLAQQLLNGNRPLSRPQVWEGP